MTKERAERRTSARFTICDGMVFIATIAISVILFKDDSKPPAYRPGPAGLPVQMPSHGSVVWEGNHRYLFDRGEWPRRGLPLVLWYVLLGPTLAGPFVRHLHGGTRTNGTEPSALNTWAVVGALMAIQVLMEYGTVYSFGPQTIQDADEDSPVSILTRIGIVLPFMIGLLLFFGLLWALPLTLGLFFSARLRRFVLSNTPNWMHLTGLGILNLWAARNLLLIILVVISNDGYFWFRL